jgi:hypothetical protein
MKNFKIKFALILLLINVVANAQNVGHNNRQGVTVTNHGLGGWRNLGTTHAKHSAEHDRIIVRGPYDYFRKLKFKVKDAPIQITRMIVIYQDGRLPEKIQTRYNIPKNGESRVIDLKGGRRKIKSIEFWYDTKGFLQGTADVTVYGLK